MKRKVAFWLAVLSMPLTTFAITGKAQGICVISERKVSEVKGVVLLPNKIPIPDATVELYEGSSEGRKIAQVKADENGRFKFAAVASGKYAVVASYPTLVALHVPVRVTASKSRKQKELVITLNGLIGEPCGGGSVDLREQEKTEKKAKDCSQ